MSRPRGDVPASGRPVAFAPIRAVVTGSESTGKTTLAGRLAGHFGAVLVPEYSREYADSVDRPLTFEDHLPIARGQMANEDAGVALATRAAGDGGDGVRGARGLVVQDTDLLSTLVYCELYHDRRPEWLAHEARDRRPHLYLLAETDVPWVADGIRDMGHRRQEVQQLFRDAVAASGTPYIVVSGDWDERFRTAVSAVRSLLGGSPGNPRR